MNLMEGLIIVHIIKIIKFENVNYYDLNTDMDTVSVGWNVHIIAKVESFDANSGLFYLDPVSVTKR